MINKKKTLVGSEDTKKSESRRFQEHSEKVLFLSSIQLLCNRPLRPNSSEVKPSIDVFVRGGKKLSNLDQVPINTASMGYSLIKWH